jgi:UDP-MurNAc hydroxylase
MQIEFIGHASFLVKCAPLAILIDPWQTRAFTSWFPVAVNIHDRLERVTHMYCSHLHADHFDKVLLKGLAKVPVILPNFPSKSLENAWKECGFTEFIRDTSEIAVNGGVLKITTIVDKSFSEDSALLLQLFDTSGKLQFAFLNLNDYNGPVQKVGRIDVLTAQFSGAQYYPQCYTNYSDAEMMEKIKGVRGDYLKRLILKCKSIKPKYYIPSAGPPIFLDENLKHFNQTSSNFTIFPTWDMIEANFINLCPETKPMPLKSGDIIEFAYDICIKPGSGVLIQPVTTDFHPFIPDFFTNHDILKHFQSLDKEQSISCSIQTQFNLFITNDVVASASSFLSQKFSIKIDNGHISLVDPCKQGYTFTIPSFLMHLIIMDEMDWEEALLSMRISLHRQPDAYDFPLFAFLRFGKDPILCSLVAKQSSSKDSTILKSGYRIQAKCPHAGQDLSEARVFQGENGKMVLECPRHFWRFDLDTGECLQGGNVKLCSTRVSDW